MSRIDRYLIGWFVKVFLLCEAAFLSLFILVTLFERMGRFIQTDAKAVDIFLFILGKVPWMILQTLPVASLLGALVSLTILSRNGETTALRTAGISLLRIARPFAVCGAVLCAVIFWFQEAVVPPASRFATEVRYVRIKGKQLDKVRESENAWFRNGASMVHVDHLLSGNRRLEGVEAFDLANGRVSRHLTADSAEWAGNIWRLTNVRIVDYDDAAGWKESQAATLEVALAPAPGDLVTNNVRSEEASMGDLEARIRSARAQGLASGRLEVDWWSKTSLPFACLILPLLSVPFALRTSRRGGLWTGVAVGIGVGFTYLLLMMMGLTLGRAGVLPPWLAAWAGNLLFAGAAVFFFRKAERGG